MSITTTIAKNTLFGAIEIGTDLITGFILGIVLARSLGAEQYGIYAYLVWLLGLAGLLVDLGLSEMAKRFIAEATGRNSPSEAMGIVRLTLVLRIAAAIVISVGLILIYQNWTGIVASAGNGTYLLIIALSILPHGLNYAFISIFRGFQKYEYAAYVTLGTAPIRLVLISILLFLGSGIREVLLVQIGTFFVGIVIGLCLLGRLMPLKKLFVPNLLEPALRNQALRYAMTLACTSIVGYLTFNQLSTFFIEKYCPVDQIGYFRLASRMAAMVMTFLPTAFSFVLTPAIAEQFGRGDMNKIKMIYITSVRYLMMMALPIEIGMIALAGPTIRILYGDEFIPVIVLMQIMLLPAAINCVGNAACAVIYGTNRPVFLLKTNILFAAVNIGLSLWLIPRHGAMGAAIVSAIPASALLVIWFATRKVQAAWPMRDTLKIAFAALVMGAVAFLIQSHLGTVLSLVVGIPLSVLVYLAMIFLLGVLNRRDLSILKDIQGAVPFPFKRPYSYLSGLLEKIVVRTKMA